MNILRVISRTLVGALCALIVSHAAGAEKATLQFTSLSVQILPATAEDPLTDLEWTSALSSVGRANSINHELMVAVGDHGYSHEGFLVLQDPFSVDPIVLPFVLDIPPFDDVNNNGIDDFFDPAMAVEGVATEGMHPNANNRSEKFSATWTRGAGDVLGSVELDYPYFGLRFNHTFQLAHYAGEFSFDRAGSNLTGMISLTNVLNADDKIAGPLTVRVMNTNTLTLSSAAWNNTAGFNYVIRTNFYDGRFETNFFSYWVLEDGYAGTGEQDYTDWIMVINAGDANGNGVIDLVEGNSTPSNRPRLDIIRGPNGYEITINGTAGTTYWLEYTDRVADPAWPNHQVVTLSSATRTVTLPLETIPGRFFRLREQ